MKVSGNQLTATFTQLVVLSKTLHTSCQGGLSNFAGSTSASERLINGVLDELM
jgi:hypothetical protein